MEIQAISRSAIARFARGSWTFGKNDGIEIMNPFVVKLANSGVGAARDRGSHAGQADVFGPSRF
ncbi:MAG: hypothetical protein EHM78_15510 [Myxococcaceae bacterium]|nr:MAG: hypothetical protein EHM78_15510 [Myxococcaceae bacterium]